MDADRNQAAQWVDQHGGPADFVQMAMDDWNRVVGNLDNGFEPMDQGHGNVMAPLFRDNWDMQLGDAGNRMAPFAQDMNMGLMGVANNGLNGNIVENALLRFVEIRQAENIRQFGIAGNGINLADFLDNQAENIANFEIPGNNPNWNWNMHADLGQVQQGVNMGQNGMAGNQNNQNRIMNPPELFAELVLDGGRLDMNRFLPQEDFLQVIPPVRDDHFRVHAPAMFEVGHHGLNPYYFNFAAEHGIFEDHQNWAHLEDFVVAAAPAHQGMGQLEADAHLNAFGHAAAPDAQGIGQQREAVAVPLVQEPTLGDDIIDVGMEQEFEYQYLFRPMYTWNVHEMQRKREFKKRVVEGTAGEVRDRHCRNVLNYEYRKTLKWYAFAERRELRRKHPSWIASFPTREKIRNTVLRWCFESTIRNYAERNALEEGIRLKMDALAAEEKEEMDRRVHVEKIYPLSREVNDLIDRIEQGEDLAQLRPRFEFSRKQFNRRIIGSILRGPISKVAMEVYFEMIAERNRSNGLPIVDWIRFNTTDQLGRGEMDKAIRGSVDHDIREILFFPVFYCIRHWLLVAVNFNTKTAECYDCSEEKKLACILAHVVEFLIEKQYNEVGSMFRLDDWTLRYRKDVPVFHNDDSGVFILQLAESIARGDEVLRPNIDNARKKILAEIGSEDKKLLL